MFMKNIIFCLFILFVLSNNNANSQAAYSEDNADAIYTNILHEFVLNPDNSTLYNYEHQLLLKSSFSFFRQYGESFIIYNPLQQKLKIKKAETLMRDGTKVKSPSNAFNEVLPRFAENAASYMHYKEMVVTHTGIEIGATVDFAYSIESSKEFLPGLLAKVVVGNRCPVRKMTVRVFVPKGTAIQYALINSAVTVQRSTASNFDVYSWEFTNLPMIEVEPNQPAFDEISPVIAFSSFTSDLLYSHIAAKTNNYNASGQLKAQIIKITENCKSNYEKIEALSNYVKKNIATIDVDLIFLGYQAQSPEITFFKRAGTFLDKGILLQWMAKTLGIQVAPVLVSDYLLPAVAQNYLPFYNNCLLKIENENGFIDFNQTQNTAIPNNLYQKSCMKLQPDFEIHKVELPEAGKVEATVKASLNQDETISGDVSFATSGLLLYDLNHKGMEALLKKTFSEGKYKLKIDENGVRFDKAKIVTTSINATIDGKISKDETNTIYTFNLPGSAGYLDNFHLAINSILRTTPVKYAFPIEEEFDYEIQIPDKWQLFGNIKNISLKNDVGIVKISMQQKNNTIIIKRYIKLNLNQVDATKYAQMQELLVGWADESGKRLQFILK